MRFATGVVAGVLLTIGAASVVDATRTARGPHGEAHRTVDWSVGSANMQDLSSDVHEAWTHLVGGAKELDCKTEV